jgi:hypothetical protein
MIILRWILAKFVVKTEDNGTGLGIFSVIDFRISCVETSEYIIK